MTDTQDYCCAAGVCCGEQKRLDAMIALLMTHAHLNAQDAASAAAVFINNFDALPKAAGLGSVVKYIQAHPYRS